LNKSSFFENINREIKLKKKIIKKKLNLIKDLRKQKIIFEVN
jgi:hypothetical protein